jgi:hypothetical protein
MSAPVKRRVDILLTRRHPHSVTALMNPTNAIMENVIEPDQVCLGKWVEDRDFDGRRDS